MDVHHPSGRVQHVDIAGTPVTIGRRGAGADITLGRTDEAQLSATAAYLHPQANRDGDPLHRGRWLLQHTNELILSIFVVYTEGRAVELRRAGAVEPISGSATLEFHVPRGALTLDLRLPTSETPPQTIVPRIDPVRSGSTSSLADRFRWTDRRHAVIAAMFPELLVGRRPQQVRSAGTVAAELGMRETTVRFHADEVRKEIARLGIDTEGLGIFHVDLGRILYDERLWAPRQGAGVLNGQDT